MVNFASRIRKKRLEKNLTQDEVAKRAGITLITYGRIERGDASARIDQIECIADALALDIQELLDGNEVKEPSAIQLINNIISDAEKLRKLMGYK